MCLEDVLSPHRRMAAGGTHIDSLLGAHKEFSSCWSTNSMPDDDAAAFELCVCVCVCVCFCEEEEEEKEEDDEENEAEEEEASDFVCAFCKVVEEEEEDDDDADSDDKDVGGGGGVVEEDVVLPIIVCFVL